MRMRQLLGLINLCLLLPVGDVCNLLMHLYLRLLVGDIFHLFRNQRYPSHQRCPKHPRHSRDGVIPSVSRLFGSRRHTLSFLRHSPWDASLRGHCLLLWMVDLRFTFGVSSSAWAHHTEVQLHAIYSYRLFVSAPPVMTHRDVDVMFYDYLNHLIPEKAQCTIAPSDWSYVDSYIWWFFRMSHPYMIHDAPGRSTYASSLENTIGGAWYDRSCHCVAYMSPYHGDWAGGYWQETLFGWLWD